MNSALFLASCLDNITASIILEMTIIAPLWVGGVESGRMGNVGFWLRYMMPPAHDRALNFYRYNALDQVWRCIFWKNI